MDWLVGLTGLRFPSRCLQKEGITCITPLKDPSILSIPSQVRYEWTLAPKQNLQSASASATWIPREPVTSSIFGILPWFEWNGSRPLNPHLQPGESDCPLLCLEGECGSIGKHNCHKCRHHPYRYDPLSNRKKLPSIAALPRFLGGAPTLDLSDSKNLYNNLWSPGCI